MFLYFVDNVLNMSLFLFAVYHNSNGEQAVGL